jgi:serine/threonine-protein kinase
LVQDAELATLTPVPPDRAVRAAGSPLAPGQTFGPRYRVTNLPGVGGMGAVYRAWDAELGVDVAVKVIRPEATADPITGALLELRFKGELLLAREVTHKNVVRIHDLGEISGIKYITMSYVDGENLLAILRRRGKLPVRRALAVTRQIASGLQAAHEAGVVHRDLKPANVMIDRSGHALIMDFGIARLESNVSSKVCLRSGRSIRPCPGRSSRSCPGASRWIPAPAIRRRRSFAPSSPAWTTTATCCPGP